MSHTPGPWHTNPKSVVSKVFAPTDEMICQLNGRNDKANARLIAAAPELLAALKEALRYLVTPTGFKDAGKGRTEQQQVTFDQVIATIAKAEGRN